MLWSSIGSLRLAAATALLATTPAFAQSPGQVTGVVKDSTGAVLPGATVTVTGADGAKHEASTSPDGSYTVSGLPPGNYRVSAAHFGFRTVLQQSQSLPAGGTLTVDFTLETNLSEEITVTAMKREDLVRKVPFSMTATREETLRVRGATNIEDVAANVGGFTVQNLGPGQSQVAMRGVSSGQIARDQPGVKEQVGVYLDESLISMSLFTPDLDLFDTNRVEVLRGPQGTLFGAGSESGTVRYITNQPKLGTTQWFGELDGSTLQHGNQAGNVKFGFNVPLGEIAALRASAYYDALGGYIDSPGIKTTADGSIQPDPTTAQNNVNTGKRFGGRIAVKFAPTDNLSITPRFLYQKIEMDGWNRIDVYNILANPFTTNRPAVTLGDREQFIQIREPYTDKWYLGDLNINYDFGVAELTSITSYNVRDVLVVRDAGALTSSITGGSIGLSEPVYSLNAPLYDATGGGDPAVPNRKPATTFTQELRLSGTQDRFRWVLGGFYAHLNRDYGQDLPVTGFTALSGIPSRFSERHARAAGQSLLLQAVVQAGPVRHFRRGHRGAERPMGRHRRPALLPLQRRQAAALWRHLRRGREWRGRVATRQHEGRRRGPSVHRELQDRRHHEDQRPGLPRLPPGRHQRPPQLFPLHAAGPHHLRRPHQLERRDRLELRAGGEVEVPRG